MKNLLNFFFCFLCLVSLSCRQGNAKDSARSVEQSLDSLLENLHARNQFDGTLLVGNKEQVLYSKAIGSANRTYDISMSVNHRFDIASINKSFIAALILRSEEHQMLRVEDTVTHYLPELYFPGAKQLSIHQLLTHSSGIPDYSGVSDDLKESNFRKFKRLHFTNEEYLDFISSLSPVASPGEKFYYSNFAYHLLAIILERVWKKPFALILEEQICRPLKLQNTFSPSSNEEVYPKLAEAYNYNPDRKTYSKNQFIDFTLGRRIYSTVGDLYLWGKALCDTTFLTTASLRKMKTNHLYPIDSSMSYGYGWVVFDGKGSYKMGNLSTTRQYIIHGGATEGYRSMLVNIEEGEYIVAFLSNIGDQTDEMALAQAIVHILTKSNYAN